MSEKGTVIDELIRSSALDEIVLSDDDLHALLEDGARVVHLHAASVTLRLQAEDLPGGGLRLTPEALRALAELGALEAAPAGDAAGAAQDEEAEQPVSPEAITRIIEYAWHHHNAYDHESSRLKQNYQRIRRFIILITWFTTLMSVLNGYVTQVSAGVAGASVAISAALQGVYLLALGGVALLILRRVWRQHGLRAALNPLNAARTLLRDRFWALVFGASALLLLLHGPVFSLFIAPLQGEDFTRSFFQFFLVVLPLTSTGYLTFASRFEAGATWVGFRQAAEAIKRKIFTLRVRRSEVRELTSRDLRELSDVIQEARDKLEDMGVNAPLLGSSYIPGREPIRPSWSEPGDDGYSPLDLNNYVTWRLLPEANWHRGRIRRDYQRARAMRALIIAVGLLGSFLAAFQLGQFVAVSVAGTTALVAYLSLMQYEQTYNIYEDAVRKLDHLVARYYVSLKTVAEKPEKTPEEETEIEAFVHNVEDILAEQRERTGASQLQATTEAEQSLSQMVNSGGTSGRDMDSLIRDVNSD